MITQSGTAVFNGVECSQEEVEDGRGFGERKDKAPALRFFWLSDPAEMTDMLESS